MLIIPFHRTTDYQSVGTALDDKMILWREFVAATACKIRRERA
jgi:hypothetical protein